MTDNEHKEDQAVVPAEDTVEAEATAAAANAADAATSLVPAGYKGPVHNAATGQTVWANGSHPNATTYGLHAIYPDGHRTAQQQWSFTMHGNVSHTVPHAKWMEMNAAQQKAFDAAGSLPFRPPGKSIKGASKPPAPAAIEAGGGSGSTGACSACGSTKTAAVKKFLTHGGLMRALCSDCVYDRNGGDQGAFAAEWGKGRPL